jgi:hypothetical protein
VLAAPVSQGGVYDDIHAAILLYAGTDGIIAFFREKMKFSYLLEG